MAEKRAAFSFRRRRSLGFSKCRWLRTTFKVPSRSIFFFNRRSALSTDSPFLSLISVKSNSHPLRDLGAPPLCSGCGHSVKHQRLSLGSQRVNGQRLGSRTRPAFFVILGEM